MSCVNQGILEYENSTSKMEEAGEMSLVDLGKKLLDSARIGETEDVRLLMGNGAPFTTDWLGSSPLHLASQGGHLDTVAVLLRAGISWDARTKLDRTSLHLAAQEGHAEIVHLLLDAGADIEARDMLRMTPLHWAVERGHFDSAEILLRNNAEVLVRNKFEKSPIEIALDNHSTAIYDLLQNYSVLKDEQLIKSEKLELDGLPTSDSTEIVTTSSFLEHDKTPLEINKSSKNSSYLKSPSGKISVPINLKKPSSSINKSLKIMQKSSPGDDAAEVQTSTSVLATLAALAEATASKSDGAIEGANWLEDHGITMLPIDNSTVVTSALEGGQSISLTEAGKLALNWTKPKANGSANDSDLISPNISNSSHQKVITIVTDASDISSFVESSSRDAPILLMNADGTDTVSIHREDGSQPAKKIKVTRKDHTSKTVKDVSKDFLGEKEQLQKQLEEAKKVAEEYKAQLIKKEHEAEEYKKKLDEMSSPK